MTSWRDNTSQQAQEDLDKLFNECMTLATEFLNKNNEFYPFSIAISTNGETVYLATKEEEKPSSQIVISDLVEAIRAKGDNYKAVSITADVTINEKKDDAIRISMEHKEDIAIEVIVPYKMQGLFKKKVQFGEPSAVPIE